MTEQTIYRVHKEDGDWFMMSKGIVNDAELSMKAKGILAYFLSKPNDWKIYLSDIIKHSKDGKSSIQNGLKELVSAGYIERSDPKQGEDGRFEPIVWHVYEQPVHRDRFSATDNPRRKNRDGKSAPTNNNTTKNKETKNNQPTLVQVWEKYIGTMLTSTQAQFLYDLPLDWEAHTSNLPDTHPDKGRTGREVVEEAIRITGLQEVRKISYTTAIVDRWMKDGYKVDTRRQTKETINSVRRAGDGGVYGA